MKTKLQEINFIVDTTMPICIVSDMASGKSYNMNEKKVTFDPSDNLLLDTVKVYLNGEEIAYWTDAEHVYDFSFTIGESTQKQSVVIVCTDAAGNVLEDIFDDIYVTTSKWIQFINNKGLLYGSILGLILLLSIIMMITIGMSGNKRVRRNA